MSLDRYTALAAELYARWPGIDSLHWLPPAGIHVVWPPDATQADRDAAAALVASWDWSDAAGDRHRRERAGESLTAEETRTVRCALRGLYAGEMQTRQAVNPLLAAAGRLTLPTPTWAAFLQAVRQQIDAESDPEA